MCSAPSSSMICVPRRGPVRQHGAAGPPRKLRDDLGGEPIRKRWERAISDPIISGCPVTESFPADAGHAPARLAG
jgi:hypothetical protein